MKLTAYYFRQHMYTLVPRHVREDMQWMADVGTHHVAVAVLEQDLTAAKENLATICAEAERVGMSVHAVPSRWGALFAGAPKVPSTFSANHPETWIRGRDGAPYFSGTWGPMSSVHHPATREFFKRTLEKLLRDHPITGVIWDEPKVLDMNPDGRATQPDFSDAAKAKMPGGGTTEPPGTWHIDAFGDFVDGLGAYARTIRPDLTLSMFIYGHLAGYPIERMAKIKTLDYFGCDGKPWAFADLPCPAEGELVKALIDQGPAFLDAARRNGKGGLLLIENHNMATWGFEIMDRRWPDVMAMKAESLMYYYYPRNVADPDAQMAIIARRLQEYVG